MAKDTLKTPIILPFMINDRWYALPVDQVEGVSPASRVTAIPGNASRTLVGLGFMLGQLMSVIDCAPAMNLGISRDARQVVICKYQGAYYAILTHQVGQLITKPKIADYKRPLTPFTLQYMDHHKKKITLIDIPALINGYICT